MMNSALDPQTHKATSGILLVNKPKGKTSFYLVHLLRRLYGVKTIGHAGTLDPFATGVMVLLIGKTCTRLSSRFLDQDKEYIATLRLGIQTDSYDCDGATTNTSDLVPTEEALVEVISRFQGTVLQTPPMFSAKKVKGKKLYELARKGISIEREAKEVTLQTVLLHYEYPFVSIRVSCSKGTYIRSIAEDIGQALGCYAHLSDLTRTRSGFFSLQDCVDGSLLSDVSCLPHLRLLSPQDIPFLAHT